MHLFEGQSAARRPRCRVRNACVSAMLVPQFQTRGPRDRVNMRISHSGFKAADTRNHVWSDPYVSILYYTILCYTVLYYTILYSTLLYSTLLYSTLLYYTIYYILYIYIIYILYYLLYTIYYILYTIYILYYILYTIHYILYTIYYILYTIYYTILYYTILYYTILYYTILYYTILYYTILYYTILQLQYTVPYYTLCGVFGSCKQEAVFKTGILNYVARMVAHHRNGPPRWTVVLGIRHIGTITGLITGTQSSVLA